MVVELCGRIRVYGRNDVVAQLRNGDGNAAAVQIFRDFNSNITAPDHNGGARFLLFAEIINGESVRKAAQGEHLWIVKAGQTRSNRFRAGRQNQFVVAFLVSGSARCPTDPHALVRPVDGDNLAAGAHVHMKPGTEAFRSLYGQLGLFVDHAANVIGQTAVGERDVISAFEQNNPGRFVIPAQARRSRRASGDPSDNYYLHRKPPLSVRRLFPAIRRTESFFFSIDKKNMQNRDLVTKRSDRTAASVHCNFISNGIEWN